MGPAVIFGQGLAENAEPVRHGVLADLAESDRKLVTVIGKRRADELLICFYDASLPRVILPCACAERALSGMRVRRGCSSHISDEAFVLSVPRA